LAIFERGETYAHWVTIRDRDNTKVDPSTVTITIKDPCSFVLVNGQNMTKSATGVYYYNYDTIQSSATYGKYKVEVVSTAASGQVGYYHDEFYVMPWKVEKDVRQITGASETKDIEDDDLSDICWKAYKEALRDVYIHYHDEAPGCNPSSGAGFNGTNTSFQTKHRPIADINGDGTVLGNNTSCATDVDCWWKDSSGSQQRGIVTVSKARNGEITITRNDGSTAIPSNNEGVYLDYWMEYSSFNSDLFQNAVSHLAADYLIRRLKEVDRVTLGDLASNFPIIEKDSRRFYRKYKQIINRVRQPKMGGIK
jgi:hypothetical protein